MTPEGFQEIAPGRCYLVHSQGGNRPQCLLIAEETIGGRLKKDGVALADIVGATREAVASHGARVGLEPGRANAYRRAWSALQTALAALHEAEPAPRQQTGHSQSAA